MIEDPALPAEVVVREWPGAIRYVLPPHQLGNFRWVGLLLIAFGLAPIGMAAAFVSFVVKVGDGHFPAFIVLLCPLPVLLVFVGIGGMFLFFGAWILAGHTEIELSDKKIRAILRVGPFRWSRRRPRAVVR